MRCLAVLSVSLFAFPAVAASYYASPSGAGTACTVDSPCSITQAQTSVRAAIAVGMSEDAVVELRGGTYTLSAALALTSADSGRDGWWVRWRSYHGERATLSGGTTVTGWTATGGGIFQAAVAAGRNFRQLYVDGVHAQRAKASSATPAGWTRTETGYTAPDESMAAWENQTDIELFYMPLAGGGWTTYRLKVASVVGDVVTMQTPGWSYFVLAYEAFGMRETPFLVLNAYELMASGSWYLNRTTSTLYYWPADGTMATHTVVAPLAEKVLTLTGTDYVEFSDITFADGNGTFVDTGTGYVGLQSGNYWQETEYSRDGGEQPGCVEVVGGQHVAFRGNTFTRMGARGIFASGGTQYLTIQNNRFEEMASGAIQVGHSTFDACESAQEHNATISGNYIPSGNEFDILEAGGIFAPCVRDSTITRNAIVDTPWVALAQGWGWHLTDPLSTNNTISRNYISTYCTLFSDCGGIYTNGSQSSVGSYETGLQVTGNYVSTGVKSLYADDGGAWETWAGNVSMGPPTYWMQSSASTHDMTFTGNYIDGGDPIHLGTDVTITPNTTISTGSQPYGTAAQAVICSTGIGDITPCLPSGWTNWATRTKGNGMFGSWHP